MNEDAIARVEAWIEVTQQLGRLPKLKGIPFDDLRTLLALAKSRSTEGDGMLPDHPFTYAYRYPYGGGGTVIRYGTGGREINGAKPTEAIPLYSDKQIKALTNQSGGEITQSEDT